MPVVTDTASPSIQGSAALRGFFDCQNGGVKETTETAKAHIEIGLVNNMPDSALKGTERQFLRLLDVAGAGLPVRLHLFTLPEIPRSDRGRHHVGESYGSIGDIQKSHLDALIITGTEPHEANLRNEPYWRSLANVLDWAEDNTVSTIVSCLAAHAAVLHFDGIHRQRLEQKCCGVFDHRKVADHPLTRSVAFPWRVAHSRWNEIPEEALCARGYSILSRSDEAGVDLFVNRRGSLFLFFQGHPEYESDTLLKEYQRDVRRFLAGERESYPAMPHDYFDPATEKSLSAYRDLAIARPHEGLMERFPSTLAFGGPASARQTGAHAVFRNWLRYVAAERAARSLTAGAAARL